MFSRATSSRSSSGASSRALRAIVAALPLLAASPAPTPAPTTPAPTTPAPTTPVPGPLHIIGSETTGGCLAGAVRLPASGPGYTTIHLGRSSFWGAPQTIAGIEALASEARSSGLGTLYVEDIAAPRGGPLPGGHEAHQLGLDVDIGLDVGPKPPLTPATRETVELPSAVRADGRAVDPRHWGPDQVTILKLAATLPGVDRVLVNPAIKQQLCNDLQNDPSFNDGNWLRLIRPWWGHAAHMHIHFLCPSGQPDCVQQAPPPPGDGCDATLRWWFAQLDAPPAPPHPPRPPPSPPVACRAVMRAPAAP